MVPSGSLIFNLLSGKGYMMAKSAGTFCKVLFSNPELMYTFLKIPTGSSVKAPILTSAYLGRSGNLVAKKVVYGYASRKLRAKKYKITVRGVAMNPVDHPNGGRTNTARPLKNPWGRPAKRNK